MFRLFDLKVSQTNWFDWVSGLGLVSSLTICSYVTSAYTGLHNTVRRCFPKKLSLSSSNRSFKNWSTFPWKKILTTINHSVCLYKNKGLQRLNHLDMIFRICLILVLTFSCNVLSKSIVGGNDGKNKDNNCKISLTSFYLFTNL